MLSLEERVGMMLIMVVDGVEIGEGRGKRNQFLFRRNRFVGKLLEKAERQVESFFGKKGEISSIIMPATPNRIVEHEGISSSANIDRKNDIISMAMILAENDDDNLLWILLMKGEEEKRSDEIGPARKVLCAPWTNGHTGVRVIGTMG